MSLSRWAIWIYSGNTPLFPAARDPSNNSSLFSSSWGSILLNIMGLLSRVAYSLAEFTSLDKDIPQKVVTQGLEIFFKYTGQSITCYCCRSTEHVVKNCLKQRSRFSHIHVEDRILTDPPNPTTSQASKNSQMETTADETSDDTPPAENSVDDSPLTRSFASITDSTPDLSLA